MVGRTQGARVPGSLKTFGCGQAPRPRWPCASWSRPRDERRPRRPRYGFHQQEVNVWGLTCGTPMTRETPSDRPGSTRQSGCQRPPYPRVRVAHRVGVAWGGTRAAPRWCAASARPGAAPRRCAASARPGAAPRRCAASAPPGVAPQLGSHSGYAVCTGYSGCAGTSYYGCAGVWGWPLLSWEKTPSSAGVAVWGKSPVLPRGGGRCVRGVASLARLKPEPAKRHPPHPSYEVRV